MGGQHLTEQVRTGDELGVDASENEELVEIDCNPMVNVDKIIANPDPVIVENLFQNSIPALCIPYAA